MFFSHQLKKGFTLVELMVVIAIIAILSAILFVNFNDARMLARDKARMTSLKELQLAIELYRAQHGNYPAAGCNVGNSTFAGPGRATVSGFSECSLYIAGLVPDFISALPSDPRSENVANMGYYYRSDGNSFKLMSFDSVETRFVTSYGDEFARCPRTAPGACSGAVPRTTYAVYSAGATDW